MVGRVRHAVTVRRASTVAVILWMRIRALVVPPVGHKTKRAKPGVCPATLDNFNQIQPKKPVRLSLLVVAAVA